MMGCFAKPVRVNAAASIGAYQAYLGLPISRNGTESHPKTRNGEANGRASLFHGTERNGTERNHTLKRRTEKLTELDLTLKCGMELDEEASFFLP